MKMTKKLIVLLLCGFCCAASIFALEGVVLSVSGKVEIQDGEDWIPLEEDDVVEAGAVISTGFKSECVIALDETTLTVKALTRLTLEQLFEQDGNKASTMYLDAGSISASVRSEEEKKVAFKVKTPAVTASVRGTDGDVYINRVEGRSGKWLLTPPEPKLTREQIRVLAEEAAAIKKAELAAAAAATGDAEEAAAGTTEEPAEDSGSMETLPEESGEEAVTEDSAGTSPAEVAAGETAAPAEPVAPAEEPAPVAAINTDELFSSLETAGGVLVHEGETSTVATAAGGTFALNTPQQTAVQAATSLGSSTATPSTTESVTASVPQAPVQAVAPVENKKASGSITLSIKWID